MVSHRAPEGQTGLMLGVQQSFGGVARMLGPLWAGAAFQYLGIRSPFFLAAGLLLAVRLFAQAVREDGHPEDFGTEVETAVPTEPS